MMATGDLPSITASTYASDAFSLNSLTNQTGGFGLGHIQPIDTDADIVAAVRRMPARSETPTVVAATGAKPMSTRRLVQVFIADPNENVPLEHAMVYSGEQKFADSTDQELFYEVDINTLLKAHNEKRVHFADKKVKERVENLEPAKIRDLKMVVVTIAAF